MGRDPFHSLFFDILVPDGETPDECEMKDYYTEKKTYLRIYMSGTTLRRDRTFVLTWDIETQSQELDEFAEVLNLKQNTEPDPHWTTIVCENQENLLKTFALCWRAFVPDIQVGFNNSDYDWRFIMERAYYLNILEWIKIGAKSENTFKKKKKKKNSENTDSENTLHILENGEEDTEVKEFLGGPIMIKISAENNFFFSFLKLPECVPIDVRVCLKKHYSHSEVKKEGSLKFFLQKCGLDAKADMPYDKICTALPEAFGTYAFKCDMLFSARIPEKMEKDKYPSVYVFSPKKELFVMRLEFKAQLASLGKKKDQLKKIISSVKEKGKRIPEKLDLEYKSLCFEYDYLNSKQKAVKLFMNTFYGEARNPLSLIFLYALAGGTTSAGKYNIKLVAEYVKKKGFRIKYGDTDSLYLTCPDKYFKKCDEAFFRGELSKEAYWTEMVKITMDVIKKLRNQINTYLRIKNSTSYLKMTYEEVLFSVCFAGKKKYFGIGHEDEVNFKPDDLFMKGIDSVKQENSELFRFIREKIMWEAIGINNTCPIQEIVKDVLRDARFSYVVVNDDSRYKEDGMKSTRKGDYMEFVNIAKEFNMEIDVSYYLEQMVGMCTCFINKDDMFQLPPSDKIMQIKDTDEKEKQIDDYSQRKAKNWLKKYIKGLQ
ncbi:hypothetical protein C1645_835203 [Glomus cerebriforme]|uniref:DNA polymerase n=1 Tax=Glomus cerebriforme TaxID=658196 RepID=A0A397S8A4_9GLOM|nr:hypothetical protein C1645_835203 [Glomus cerebriforme]